MNSPTVSTAPIFDPQSSTNHTVRAAISAAERLELASHTLPSSSDPLAALPPVPVLPGTLLGLELLIQQPAFDLRAASHLICEDPGALLHLFALAREEYSGTVDPPSRVEECIASLSSQHLLRSLARAGGVRREQARFAKFARHGVAVGRCASIAAHSLGLPREAALIVGTLHELGTLPAILSFVPALPLELPPDVVCCQELAQRYGLPGSLQMALDAVHRKGSESIWNAVIDAAHDLLGPAPHLV